MIAVAGLKYMRISDLSSPCMLNSSDGAVQAMGRMIADALQKTGPSNLRSRVDTITIYRKAILQRELSLQSLPRTISPVDVPGFLDNQLKWALEYAARDLGGSLDKYEITIQNGEPTEITCHISYN